VPLGEFELIERYFSRGFPRRDDVVIGVGDDAAIVRVPSDAELVVAVDTLVSGVHFPEGLAPMHVGHRALAVNLSDMAAMGALPCWCTLALTLPAVEERWLEEFARGLRGLALRHSVALIGGDTTRGPLTISVQILGVVPVGAALRRSGARAGDLVFVSGTTGDAAAGLGLIQGTVSALDPEHAASLQQRFLLPAPRVELGLALRAIASAAIDVSDGLHADLGKMLQASGAGAQVHVDRLPISRALMESQGVARARRLALGGGDDYELCFTVPASRVRAAEHAAGIAACEICQIGTVEAEPGVRYLDGGRPVVAEMAGYDHFAR
jgi:thiamine-monophosphate kinase